MAIENVKKDEERLEKIESTLGKSEMFIEKNKKTIIIVVIAAIVVVLAFLGIKKFYWEPRQAAAANDIWHAEQYFDKGDFKTALEGDSINDGFKAVVEKYGSTKSGNLAKYYAGICSLQLGQFEDAIDYLKDFDSKDFIMSALALYNIGNAYMELGEMEQAADYYMQAAEKNHNITLSPMMMKIAGDTYDMMGDYKKALEVYNRIRADYPKSTEADHVQKNIAMVEAKLAY